MERYRYYNYSNHNRCRINIRRIMEDKQEYGTKETIEFIDAADGFLAEAITRTEDGEFGLGDVVGLGDNALEVFREASDYKDIMLECGELSKSEVMTVSPKAIKCIYSVGDLAVNINKMFRSDIPEYEVKEQDVVTLKALTNAYNELAAEIKTKTDDQNISISDIVSFFKKAAYLVTIAANFKDIVAEFKDLEYEEALVINGIVVQSVYNTIGAIANLKEMYA